MDAARNGNDDQLQKASLCCVSKTMLDIGASECTSKMTLSALVMIITRRGAEHYAGLDDDRLVIVCSWRPATSVFSLDVVVAGSCASYITKPIDSLTMRNTTRRVLELVKTRIFKRITRHLKQFNKTS